uniref:Uncharacterized protein AlNc14C9G1149 n=1 Tax=Albugo laibachii Nc14 TaxID=890382 RepID=F0W296_9STRA|nr:conserved hypothetical protein [Albugo laibachii Nc14]|eukprot:CCA15181.1 conserved hypothetical protein [Albugo laibachii Nc14]
MPGRTGNTRIDFYELHLGTGDYRWKPVLSSGQTPDGRYGHAGSVYRSKFLIFGGNNGSYPINEFKEFHIDEEMPVEIPATTLTEDLRGLVENETVSDITFIGSYRWRPILCSGEKPARRQLHAGSVYRSRFLMFGGRHGLNLLNDFKKLQFEDESWFETPPTTISTTIIEDLRALVDNETLSDISFIGYLKGCNVSTLLCIRCPYFNAMLTGAMVESRSREIIIQDTRRPIFLLLLEYLYCDTIEVPSEDAMELLVAAGKSALPRLPGLEDAVQTELINIRGKHQLFLRSTSSLSTLIRDFAYRVGHSYFKNGISHIFDDAGFYRERANCVQKEENKIQVILEYVESVIHKLVHTAEFGPPSLRACTHYILKKYVNEFGESKHALPIAVGNVLILRIICPALIKPEILGFQPHTRHSLPIGIQIARVLQQTLNRSLLDETTSNYKELNEFVASFGPMLREYLCAFSYANKAATEIQRSNHHGISSDSENGPKSTIEKQSNAASEATKKSLDHYSGIFRPFTQDKEKVAKHNKRSQLWSKIVCTTIRESCKSRDQATK